VVRVPGCRTELYCVSCEVRTEFIYVKESRPPLWSSGQISWLQIQRSEFDSRHYHIFREVVGLERGPLSLVTTTVELLGRKSSGFSLEIREYGRRDQSRWSRGTLYTQKLALTSPTNGCRSVGIVRPRTQASEFSLVEYNLRYHAQWGRSTNTARGNLRVHLQSRKAWQTRMQDVVGDKQTNIHISRLATEISPSPPNSLWRSKNSKRV
jgi:hypothetical protein